MVLYEKLPCFSKIVENGKLLEEDLEGMSKLVKVMLKTFARTTNMDRFGHNKVS